MRSGRDHDYGVASPQHERGSPAPDLQARLRSLHEREPVRLPPNAVPAHFRRAAVVLLVGARDGRPFLVLTERAAHLRAHASEICLPGGRVEPGETDEDAAIREAAEELGCDAAATEVCGRLDEAWSGAGNVVTPIVAWYSGAPRDLRANPDEVARVLVADLLALARPGAQRVEVVTHDGNEFDNDVIDADGFEIYGLTADIVLDLLAWIGGRDRDRVPGRLDDLRRFLGSAP